MRSLLRSGIAFTLGFVVLGCGPNDEPTANQKKLVPEAKGGGQVKVEGDKFTRTSDRN